MITATGPSGTARGTGTFKVNNFLSVAGNTGTDTTVNTTTAHAGVMNAQWASTTGAPTISSDWSEFERIGT